MIDNFMDYHCVKFCSTTLTDKKQYYLDLRGVFFGPPCIINQLIYTVRPCTGQRRVRLSISLENRFRKLSLFMWDQTDRKKERQAQCRAAKEIAEQRHFQVNLVSLFQYEKTVSFLGTSKC